MSKNVLKFVVGGCMIVSLAAQSFGHDLPPQLTGWAADFAGFATGLAMLAYQWESKPPEPEKV